MELSINTDFMGSTNDVSESIKLIGEAGFQYIHWCHHWNDDYIYSNHEILEIGKLLKNTGLQLFDLHSSHGKKMDWCSTNEQTRLEGEKLLLNRIYLTHSLGGRAVVLHTNINPINDETRKRTEQGAKTLLSLETECRKLGIRIGLENLNENTGEPSLYDLNYYFSRFPSDYIGLCWDTGHSNLIQDGIDKIKPFIQRLLILHMNGNYGKKDEHLPIGEGTVDWTRVVRIIAASPYDGVLTQEVNIKEESTPKEFLRDVYKRGIDFAARIENLR